MGAEIISAAAHPGVGLLIDAWHVFRAGTSIDELRTALTPEMVFGVELDDAAADMVGSMFEDTVNHRLLCGEGAFDLRGLIGVLRDNGFDGPWGVEILSTTFRELPVREALKVAADTRAGTALVQSGTLTQAPPEFIDSTRASATRAARSPSVAVASVDGLPCAIESIHSCSSMR